MYNSTRARIQQIREITQKHYEEGNQSKCYRAIWRRHIYPAFGICYRTYLNYVNTPMKTS